MNNKRSPEISVIIVNFNGKFYLKKCLLSLKKNLKNNLCEIIVIDNASTDGSQEMIADFFPDVLIIGNKKNIGYPEANNQGISKSRGEHLLFLNPDTIVYPGAVDILMSEIYKNPRAGAVGPAMWTESKKFQVSFGRRVDFFAEFLQKYLLNPYYRLALKKRKAAKETGWLSGACLLARKDVVIKAGMFDHKFFLYFEDIDLCYRIRKGGWKLYFLPAANIYHSGGSATAVIGLSSRYFYRKSQIYFYKKHNSGLSLFLLRFFLSLNFLIIFLRGFLLRKKDLKERKNFFRLLR